MLNAFEIFIHCGHVFQATEEETESGREGANGRELKL